MEVSKLYINGEWTDSNAGNVTEVKNKYTGEVIGKVFEASQEDVDQAVAAAKEAYPAWQARPVSERIDLMKKLLAELENRKQEIADVIVAELGSTRTFVENGHLPLSLSEIDATIQAVEDYEFEHETGNAVVIEEGYGVVACITPWNYPLLQIERKVVPALLAGNTAVLKPASLTPLTAVIYAEAMEKADFPKGVFNLVTGSGSRTGDYLAKHEDVDVVSFTGSTAVGMDMYDAAKNRIKQLILELGGKSAMIFLEGGDLETCIKTVYGTCVNNMGQTCTALTRLFVPKSELENVKEALIKHNEAFAVYGDPNDPETTVGSMVSEGQAQTVLDYIEAGKAEGAEILFGGNKVDGPGQVIEPTVFVNATNDMKIAQEEIFGPVLTVITYETVEEAIAMANDNDYGLSGAVVGPQEEAEKVARQLLTGNIIVNGADRNPYAPFGGYKLSGLGRENGIYGVKDYLQEKAIFL